MSHAAATAFGLQVNVKKTVVMHQAPSHDKSLVSNTNITLNGTKLNVVTTFTYRRSILTEDAHRICGSVPKIAIFGFKDAVSPKQSALILQRKGDGPP